MLTSTSEMRLFSTVIKTYANCYLFQNHKLANINADSSDEYLSAIIEISTAVLDKYCPIRAASKKSFA